MNGEAKMGLGLVAAMALCCGGPLILSALASGVVLGALGAVWDGGRLPLLGGGAVVLVGAVWLLARRLISPARGDATCCTPMPSPGVGDGDDTAARVASVREEPHVVASADRTGVH